jgi:hypothetical protein
MRHRGRGGGTPPRRHHAVRLAEAGHGRGTEAGRGRLHPRNSESWATHWSRRGLRCTRTSVLTPAFRDERRSEHGLPGARRGHHDADGVRHAGGGTGLNVGEIASELDMERLAVDALISTAAPLGHERDGIGCTALARARRGRSGGAPVSPLPLARGSPAAGPRARLPGAAWLRPEPSPLREARRPSGPWSWAPAPRRRATRGSAGGARLAASRSGALGARVQLLG